MASPGPERPKGSPPTIDFPLAEGGEEGSDLGGGIAPLLLPGSPEAHEGAAEADGEHTPLASIERPNAAAEDWHLTEYEGYEPEAPPLEATASEEPPSVPEGPDFEFAQELMRTSTHFQRLALEKLRFMDSEVTGRFSARQAFNFVHALRTELAPSEESPEPWRLRLRKAFAIGVRVSLLVLALLLFQATLSIAAQGSEELLTKESGLLVTAGDGQPVAAGAAATLYSLASLQAMPAGMLRNIHDCSFQHQGAHWRLRVASLVRELSGDLHITAADGSSLQVRGRLESGALVTFAQPFRTGEAVRLEGGSCTFADLGAAGASH